MSIDLRKENGFILKKVTSRCYPTGFVTVPDYADNLSLHANIPPQAKSLLHNLALAAEDIDRYVYANKTELYFKWGHEK